MHLMLYRAYRDPQLQMVKITHICLIWDQIFANIAV